MSQNRTDKKKAGCTQAYTWEMIYDMVTMQYALKKSLRRIAKEDYNGKINHAVIQRILQGKEPRNRHIRHVLGLKAEPTRPRRIAIRCDDMQSAARSIRNNLDSEQVKELIQELNHEGQEKNI